MCGKYALSCEYSWWLLRNVADHKLADVIWHKLFVVRRCINPIRPAVPLSSFLPLSCYIGLQLNRSFVYKFSWQTNIFSRFLANVSLFPFFSLLSRPFQRCDLFQLDSPAAAVDSTGPRKTCLEASWREIVKRYN